jgi:intracellular septation protein
VTPWLRLALDLGPLLVFFLVNAKFGIWWATGIFMALSVLVLAWHWFASRKLPAIPLATTVMVLIFGSLTLYLADEQFIKMKPTILYVLFAAVLSAGLMRGELLLARLFDATFVLPDSAWRVLTWRFIALFLVLAVANEAIWRTQTTAVWAASKLGFWLATFVFSLAQTPFLLRHNQAQD